MVALKHILAEESAPVRGLEVRRISPGDLRDALAKGLDDFNAKPSHVIFLCFIYPIVGLLLARLAFGYSVLPMLYPLLAGFPLVGPVAAIGLYELSRRREKGLEISWRDAWAVMHSPSAWALFSLAMLLAAIFVAWLVCAQFIYAVFVGSEPPGSFEQLARQILFTWPGWGVIVVGNAVGLGFAAVVLTISVVSFPLLVDRDVGALPAVLTSVKAVAANPGTMILWGGIVAAAIVVGSLPFFFGLAIVVPILGHATWHLYRKLVVQTGSV